MSHPWGKHQSLASQLAPPGTGMDKVKQLAALTVLEKFYEHPDSLKGLVGVVVDANFSMPASTT